MDLIHGLPGQTPEIWRRDLARALELRPRAPLALRPRHRGGHAVRRGPRGRAARAARRARGAGDARAGARADRRRPATSGTRSRTSRGRAGAAATTSTAGVSASTAVSAPGPTPSCARRPRCGWRTRPDTDEYVRRIAAGGDAVATREEPPPRQFAGEALMLGLRTADGVDETAFARTHGAPPRGALPGGRGARRRAGLDRERRRPPAPDRNGHPLLERDLPPALLVTLRPACCRGRPGRTKGGAGRGGAPWRTARVHDAVRRVGASLPARANGAESRAGSARAAVSARPPCS